jgi:hypothetical protein
MFHAASAARTIRDPASVKTDLEKLHRTERYLVA